jgi:hypothetical protein
MGPLPEWLRPPRGILLILFLFTVVSICALAWLGWKSIDQERLVEAQQAHEKLEQAADRVAAAMRGTLAELGDRLSDWVQELAPAYDPEIRGLPCGLYSTRVISSARCFRHYWIATWGQTQNAAMTCSSVR